MSLQPGHKLAHYEILEPIGKGGMGQVYRAKDGRLDRDVAIKVLPDELAQDEERLRRFQREAKVLASLNHPNIASIYGLEQSGDTHYLVLELVPGETLADRIARGPIPVDEALEIAQKIAEALEEAHEQGIVHRDLKPVNVKLTPDDKVKVLDFGLAKAFVQEGPEGDAATSMSPTITRDATRIGVILGTAAYMSPEQARGKAVDKRTDIFAFGAVLYEMITGRKAFHGEDVSETLAAVIKSEPDLSYLPSSHVRKIVRRCLEKDSRRRLRDIGDARLELEGTPEEEPARTPVTGSMLWLGLAAGLAAGLAIAFGLHGGTSVPPSPVVTRFAVPRAPSMGADATGSGTGGHFGLPMLAISPDGSTFVSASNAGLTIRRVDTEEMEHFPGLSGNGPFFSPDGEWLGLFTQGELKKVSLTGGSRETIATVSSFLGADWGEDGTIVFADRRTGIWRVSADGGEPQLVVEIEGMVLGHPELVGYGKLLFGNLGTETSAEQLEIMAATLDTGEVKPLNLRGTQPRYLSSGHLVFVDQGSLKAVAFDPGSLEVRGTPVELIDGLTDPGGILVAHYAVSDSGSLAYWIFAPTRRLSWVDRRGNVLSTVSEPRGYADLRLSADGTSLAIFDLSSSLDVWTYNFARETFARISLSPQTDEIPVWSPDGRYVAYTTTPPSGVGRILHRRASDGSGPEEALWESRYHTHVADWTDDGRTLVLNEDRTSAGSGWDVLLLDAEGEPSPRYLLESRFDERNPRLHPGGKLLVYMSDETGQYEIYVTSFPEPDVKRSISSGGAVEPVWSKDGGELFFRNGTDIMAVEVIDESELAFSKPVALFRDTFEGSVGASHTSYDVHPDGRFLFVTRPVADEEDPYRGLSRYHVVVNWIEEVKRLVPTN